MVKSARKARGFAGYDPQGLALFLRRAHPLKTARAVEARARVPARTVERWLGEAPPAPSLAAFVQLVAAYGPSLLAAAVPGLAWIERAATLADHDGVAAEIAALRRRQARLADALRPTATEDRA